jgi:hypothetical protein
MRLRTAVVACVALWPAVAAAEPRRAWHAGLNLRTELGTHPVRVDGGVRFCRLDLILVLDPLFWIDGENDIDLLAGYRVTDHGWTALAGWRPASIGLADGRQFQHSLLLGFAGPLPKLGPVQPSFGIELAVILAKHGGGLPADSISFGSARELGDDTNVSLFARFEYAAGF